ncbi:MAG TPA: glycosyltransferase family 87 protein [Pirellulales bacterium]|nr:glycosyltransferase family 87 protein [Pirellulales bacterium]
MKAVVSVARSVAGWRRVACWLLGLAALVTGLACWPASNGLAPDYMQFWSASRILAAGGNPYDPQLQTAENAAQGWRIDDQGLGRYPFLPYYYPPWLALALVPLVPLGYGLAKCVWLALLIEAVLAVAFLLRRQIPGVSPLLTMLLTAGFGVWWTALPIGQTTPLVVLLAVAVWRLGEARRDVLAGMALAWLTIKPQLALLVIAGTLVWAARQRRWKLIAGCFGCAALLLGVSTWAQPDWLPAMLDAPRVTPLVTAENPWMGASWFCLLGSLGLSGPIRCAAYVAVALPAAGTVLWLAWRRQTSLVDLLGTGCWAAPLVAPYARYYDLALMLVPLVALARRPMADRTRGLLLVVFMIVPAATWIVYPGEVTPVVSQVEWVWMPLALAAFYVASLRSKHHSVAAASASTSLHWMPLEKVPDQVVG